MSTEYQPAEPRAVITECGPKIRGGPGLWFLLIMGTIIVLIMVAILCTGPSFDDVTFAMVVFLLIGVPTALGWWLLFRDRKKRRNLPHCRYVLRDDLKFMMPAAFNDVFVTTFFRPDQCVAGSATCLLIFLENISGRQRLVTLTISASAQLGLPSSRKIRVALTAAQTAVYRLPLRLSSTAKPGERELKIQLRIKKKNGAGMLLPAMAGRLRYKETLSTRSILTINPSLTVVPSSTSVAEEPLAGESYLSLYEIGCDQPRFELLRLVSEMPPTYQVRAESGK